MQQGIQNRGGGGTKTIPLTKGAQTIVDADAYESLAAHRWKLDSAGYVARTKYGCDGPTYLLMHRVIMDAPAGAQVDHKDGDPLNNCRTNLRLCTGSQNQGNSRRDLGRSGFRGVSKIRKRWMAYISVKNQRVYLGLFVDREDAARAYDAAALEHFGEFATLNFPHGVHNA